MAEKEREGFHPWGLTEPNGYTLENCVTNVVFPDSSEAFYDESCGSSACFFCDLEAMPTFHLRGEDLKLRRICPTGQFYGKNMCF